MIKPGPAVFTNTDEGSLICPKCGGYTTHIDHVQVAARGEDKPFNEICVNAVTGQVSPQRPTPAPTGNQSVTADGTGLHCPAL